MLLMNAFSNITTADKAYDSSCLYRKNMISLQNNPDSFPKMRFSDCVKKNMLKMPVSPTSASPYPDDPHQSESDNEEDDDWKSDGESSNDEEEQRIRSNPNYMSKVDFALRLGYDESHLMTVLKRLGSKAEQNDILLAELVKLFASTTTNTTNTITKMSEGSEDVSSPPPESALPNKDSSPAPDNEDNLRMIVIDGSNVAMQHGNKKVFSCKGIKYAVDYFKQRGHQKIVVFVPLWRKESPRKDAPITDQEILLELEKERILVFTPARTIKGRRVACYDDRYILKVANELDGIVVSNDNYRDLLNESEGFRKVIEERLLMYSFMDDKFMPPDDPLGRHGPSLDNFLCKTPTVPEPLPPNCPYGKKCTYGNKCKYRHPERGNMPHKTVTEKLAERYKPMIQEVKDRATGEVEKNRNDKKTKPKATLLRMKFISPKEDDFPSLTRDDTMTSEERQRSDDYNEKLNKLAMKIKQSKSLLQEHPSNNNNNNNGSSNNNNNNNNNNSPNPDVLALGLPSKNTNLSNLLQAPPTEPLVSGHLQVAKKLSDDATKDAELKSMGSNPVGGGLYPNNSHYSPPTKLGSPNSSQHPKVSRQLGIYSEEDPRLNRTPHHNTPITGSRMQFWKEPAVDHSYQTARRPSYQEDETYQQNQSFVYAPVISPPLPPMRNTPEKYISYPRSALTRQSSYPNTWMQVPVMDQFNSVNINLRPSPYSPHSVSNSHDQMWPSGGLYEHVLTNPGMGAPVSFPNSSPIPRPSFIDPNPYAYSPTPLGSNMMGCFPLPQSTPHHCPQPSPTHRVTQPSPQMTSNQPSPVVHIQESVLYKKLCVLFPKELVLEVLKKYPDETNPIELCRHLVSYQQTENPSEFRINSV